MLSLSNIFEYDLILDSTSLQHSKDKKILSKIYSLIFKKLKKGGFFYSINLNSSKGLHDKRYRAITLKKNELISLLMKNKFSKLDYNYFSYSEHNQSKFIKFNLISALK